jgi:hypothetical protein
MFQLRRALFTSLAIAVLSLCAAQTSSADTVVFDNGAPNGINGRNIGGPFYTAEDFTLTSAQSLTSVRFWGLRATTLPGAFTGQIYWEFRANAAGAPGAVLTSGLSPGTETFRAPSVFAGLSSYQYDFSVGSVNLSAGTYWLVLHNGAFGTTTTGDLFWETTAPNATSSAYQRTGTASSFIITTPPANHLAFQINAADGAPIPEPTTLVMLGLGLTGVAGAVRRHRKTNKG